MKLHIGTDDVPGLVHSFEATGANVHLLTPSDQLILKKSAAHLGGYGILRDREARRASGSKSGLERRHASRPAQSASGGRSRPSHRALQGEDACQGRASVPLREAGVRLRGGPLPRSGDEREQLGAAARILETIDDGAMPGSSTAGFVCLLLGRRPRNETAEGRITPDRAVLGVWRDSGSRSNAEPDGLRPVRRPLGPPRYRGSCQPWRWAAVARSVPV